MRSRFEPIPMNNFAKTQLQTQPAATDPASISPRSTVNNAASNAKPDEGN